MPHPCRQWPATLDDDVAGTIVTAPATMARMSIFSKNERFNVTPVSTPFCATANSESLVELPMP
jgi:hypothetical protein